MSGMSPLLCCFLQSELWRGDFEHVAHFLQVAIVRFGGDSEQVCKQWIDAHVAEGARTHISYLEVWTNGTESHLHVAHGVVPAMSATMHLGVIAEYPAQIGHHHYIAHIDASAVVQIFWQFSSLPCTNVVHTL